MLPILILFTIYFSSCLLYDQKNAEHQPNQLSKIEYQPDSIEVNGNRLSFIGTSCGKKFQVYYQLKTEDEQKFFKNLDKNGTLVFTGTLSKPEGARNYNGFNNVKYLASQNIYRQINIESINGIQTNSNFSLQLLRRRAIIHIQKKFPSPCSNYITGLLFGYLGKDFGEMSDLYSSLGIIHLFALSGMHVNFFLDWFRKIFLRLGLTREKIKILQIPFSILYAFLTGLSISVIRALVQKLLPYRKIDNFAMMLILILIFMPKALLTIGGQLTILYAFAMCMTSFKKTKKAQTNVVNYLWSSICLTLVALPLLIFYFHSFQPLSILLTFIFSFIFSTILLPLIIIAFFVSFTGIIIPCNFIFLVLEGLIRAIDKPLHYPFVFGSPNIVQLLLLFIFTGLFIDFYRHTKMRLFFLSGLILIYLTCKYPFLPTITVIDVGQGDSIFLEDRFDKQNILIDTGGKVSFMKYAPWQSAQAKTNAEYTLIPYLQSIGVGKIDHLILTHTDDDHVGDFLKLADKIKISEVLVSPGELSNPVFVRKLTKANLPVHVVKTGDTIPIFNSKLEILSSGYTGKGDNNDSIITYGNFYGSRFLFTGDLEREGEKELINNFPLLKVDVLKAGHHGSKTSSDPDFIERIGPRIALISVGKNNRYGHPNQETLETYNKNKIKVLRTDLYGAIQFYRSSNQWQIRTVK